MIVYVKSRNSVYRAQTVGRSLLVMLVVAGLGINEWVCAYEKHQHNDQTQSVEPTPSRPPTPQQCTFTDSSVVTSDGESVLFYSDLVKDKTVVISFVYTDCTTICSPIAITVGFLEDLLGDRMGSDVHLISVSLDPVTDTPERLRTWSERFNPGPYWKFVTGEKRVIDDLLKSLKVFTPNYKDHPPIMIVANDRTQNCTYVNGWSSPENLRDVIDEIAHGMRTGI